MYKKLLTFLLITIFISACKSKDTEPINSFQVDGETTLINGALYRDFEVYEGEYNMEFYWFDLSYDELIVYANSDEESDISGLFLDVYSDVNILQNGTYTLNENSKSSKIAYGEVSIFKNGVESYVTLVEGTVEITGTDTGNLTIKLTGVGENGEKVSGYHRGEYTDILSVQALNKNNNGLSIATPSMSDKKDRNLQKIN